MARLEVSVEALAETIDYFERMPEVSSRAARLAINQVASRSGMKLAQEAIYDEVAFPKGYLTGDRLRVGQYASESNLEATIIGRKRATSLARFAQGQQLGSAGRLGVRVRVKGGSSEHLRRAWLVRLRRGASLDEDNYNIGLAIRVNPGESVVGKYSSHSSWLVPGSVALLYGPSVDQIFRSVAEDIAPQIGDMVADEFFRQFSRLSS